MYYSQTTINDYKLNLFHLQIALGDPKKEDLPPEYELPPTYNEAIDIDAYNEALTKTRSVPPDQVQCHIQLVATRQKQKFES